MMGWKGPKLVVSNPASQRCRQAEIDQGPEANLGDKVGQVLTGLPGLRAGA
jgi:hypothetical protein